MACKVTLTIKLDLTFRLHSIEGTVSRVDISIMDFST